MGRITKLTKSAVSVLTVAVLSVAAVPLSAGAAPLATNGDILYSYLYTDNAATAYATLRSVNPDTKAVQSLSPETFMAYNLNGVWSPDGSKIAYRNSPNGVNFDLYVMNADGTNKTQVTTGTDVLNPVWSPDGTKLVFPSYYNGSTLSDITVVDADGSDQARLTSTPAFSELGPTWSTDSTKITYTGPGEDLYTMNADGSNGVRLTTNMEASNPVWSPDGTKILFRSYDIQSSLRIRAYVMDADGSNQTPLTTGINTYRLSWSPDGTKIAFHGSAPADDNDIYVMNANGSNLTVLTSNTITDNNPVWSPDGTKLAYTTESNGAFELRTMNIDGSDNQLLVSAVPTNGDFLDLAIDENAWRAIPSVAPSVPQGGGSSASPAIPTASTPVAAIPGVPDTGSVPASTDSNVLYVAIGSLLAAGLILARARLVQSAKYE